MVEEIRCDADMLFLRMSPSWMFVDDLRRFVESFCAASCPGVDREEQLALAAHELVQNAIAYASAPGVELKLQLDRETGRVRVSVTNEADPEHLALLRARLDEISGEADPLIAYLAAMRRAPEERGGLGLPRVRYEAALELRIEAGDGRVTVHAEGPLAPPEPPARVFPQATGLA
jgi:anti-sigma regulatory factor (Ser/Thr protein kinase)